MDSSGRSSKWFRIQLFLVRQWKHISVSLRRPGGFHALPREDGPQILILRSIPPSAGGFWTNFTHFHGEDGLVPEVPLDTRSGVSLRTLLEVFLMKVDPDPVHELSG